VLHPNPNPSLTCNERQMTAGANANSSSNGRLDAIFALTRLPPFAMPEPHLNNQQRVPKPKPKPTTTSVVSHWGSIYRIKNQFQFEWSSWIRIHLTFDNSRPGRSPTLQRDNQPSIAIALGIEPQLFSSEATTINLDATVSHCIGARFDRQTRSCSMIRFQWSSWRRIHISLCQIDERRDGLTERRAMERVSLRYIVLRSVIAPSVWPYHNLSKPSQL
jgi:hypothetical protein